MTDCQDPTSQPIQAAPPPTPDAPAMPAAADALERPVVELVGEQADSGASLLINAPTGSGKTWLSMREIATTIEAGGRAVYLTPLRALAQEMHAECSRRWGEDVVGVYTAMQGGDDASAPLPVSQARLVIVTPEKFCLYLRNLRLHMRWLALVDLLVVDEIHTLGEGSRGATLEGVITRFAHLNPYARVISMSATLGNVGQLSRWLGAVPVVSRWRPVPLRWSVQPCRGPADKNAKLLEHVRSLAQRSLSCIVFVQARSHVDTLVRWLAAQGVVADGHHAGLSSEQRQSVEQAYRSGQTQCLVATGSLGMGVNVGAAAVILYELQRYSEGALRDLRCSEVWQLAGRAGRLGLNESGEVVLLAPARHAKRAQAYLQGDFEPVASAIDERDEHLDAQVLACIGAGLAATTRQCQRVLSGLLLAHQRGVPAVEADVHASIQAMIAAGMLHCSANARLSATAIGRTAVRYAIGSRSAAAWARLHAQSPSPALLAVLVAVCAADEFHARLRAGRPQRTRLHGILVEYGLGDPQELDRALAPVLAQDDERYASALKTALALWSWTQCGSLEAAAITQSVQPHEIDDARREAVRLLQAMHALASVSTSGVADADDANDEAEPPTAAEAAEREQRRRELLEQLIELRLMVSSGLQSHQARLAMLDGVGPVLARRLVEAGFQSLGDVAHASAHDVAQIQGVALARAAAWVERARALIGEPPMRLFEPLPLESGRPAGAAPTVRGRSPRQPHQAGTRGARSAVAQAAAASHAGTREQALAPRQRATATPG